MTDSENTFETVYGKFTLRRPSIFLTYEIHKQAARTVGGILNLDSMGELYGLWMATVAVCAMTEEQVRRGLREDERPRGWPKGFSWEDAYDPEFLPDLVKRFNEWQASFRKPKNVDTVKEGGAGGSEILSVLAKGEVSPAADGPALDGDDGPGDSA